MKIMTTKAQAYRKKSVLYDQTYLKQTGRIRDVATHPSLGSYPNLIFLDRGLIPRLLHSLVPIHLIWLCVDKL